MNKYHKYIIYIVLTSSSSILWVKLLLLESNIWISRFLILVLVAEVSLSDDHLLDPPGCLHFTFLSVFRAVTQTNTGDVTQNLTGELEPVCSAPAKHVKTHNVMKARSMFQDCENRAAYRKKRFFLVPFSITSSLDLPNLPSRMIQMFSLVSASSVSAVIVMISYSDQKRKSSEWIPIIIYIFIYLSSALHSFGYILPVYSSLLLFLLLWCRPN